MAEVFLAREPLSGGLNKILVIKKIHSALGDQPQFRQMFEDEAKVAVILNHPNIVQTFGYGQIGPTYFLAMEHVEGVDLLRLLNAAVQSKTRLPIGLAAYLGQQVAKALDYAHRKADEYGEPLGIVHRDISPQNILVSWDGMVKLVDFGIARARHLKNDDGVVKGKFSYMSPEQASGVPVDARSDIFSMGIVLWEMTTLRSLFGGLKGRAAIEAIKRAPITLPQTVEPSIPADLSEIIMKALERDRDRRFQTARDLHRALGKFFFELSAQEGQIFESGAMAAFVSQVVPKSERLLSSQTSPPEQRSRERAATPASSSALSKARGPLPGSATVKAKKSATADTMPLQENKPVVVVECVLHGATAVRSGNRARAEEALGEFRRTIENVAYKFGAHADRMPERSADWITDESFTCLLGLTVAGEDDPARGIRLGLALIETLDGISRDLSPPLRLAVGVQRGLALVTRSPGAVEGARGPAVANLAYELTGPTALIAKRLAAGAKPGEVLVGGGVYRTARSDWRFEELDSILLPPEDSSSPSDKEQRAKVYRLIGGRKRLEAPSGAIAIPQMVGRQAELAVLQSIHATVLEKRQARHVLVLGEAGVGKRTLVDAFRRNLDREKHLVLRAIGRPSLRDTPYALIADLMRGLLGVDEAGETLAELLGMAGTGDAANRPNEGTSTEKLEKPDAIQRRHEILTTVRRLAERLAEGRMLVILVEDLHWADSQSFDILQALIHESLDRAVLGVATARPTDRVSELSKESNALTISVGELSQAEREELVYRRFEKRAEVEPLGQRILERAGGNPFYVNELIESLLERGVLKSDEGSGWLRWIKRDDPLNVPTTVEAVVASRLDRLPEDERNVIRRAALLGRLFQVDDLQALYGKDPRAALDRLAKRGLIEAMLETADPSAKIASSQYGFRNLITREVAYAGLSPDTRALLHSVAADRLRRSSFYRSGLDDAQLAAHLSSAGDRLGAGRALLSAGLYAREGAGSADAFKLLSSALEILPADALAERYQIHAEREQILRGWGKRRLQLREAYAMRRVSRALQDPLRQGESHARLALLYLEVGKHSHARREIAQSLELARAARDPRGESEALRIEATLLMNLGQNLEALELARRALSVLGAHVKTGATDERGRALLISRAHALNVIGNLQVYAGRLGDAVTAYAESLVIYRHLGVRRLEAATLNNMGWALVGLGEYEEGLIHYQRSLKLAQELGDRAGIGVKLSNIGQTYADLGDFDRAHRYLDKAIEVHSALADQIGLADAYISDGQTWLREREPSRARPRLEQGLKLARETQNRYQEVRALVYLSLNLLELGEPPSEVLQMAQSALVLAKEAQIASGEVHALMVCALGHLRAGDSAAGFASSRQAVDLLDRGLTIEGPEEILHVHGQLARAIGDLDTAKKMWERALGEVERKASRLGDSAWRARYLEAPPVRDIVSAASSVGITGA